MIKRIPLIVALLALLGRVDAQQPVYLDASKSIEERVEDALTRMTLEEKVRILHGQSKFSSAGVPRLGLPDFWFDDGPHGVRPDVIWDQWRQAGHTNDSCVAFPALTCLAATWNPEIAREYGHSLGEEALYREKDMMLGPGVNIFRTPLNGRNFEYMGEDPYLAAQMVVPYIQGLQSCGVAACVKHYCLNNSEIHRHNTNVIVSDRALNEIYLPAFKAAVTQGHTWGIMGSYNLYQKQHNCHNSVLINDILKGQWNYDGVVISDWGGTYSTDQAVNNGLDIEMGTDSDPKGNPHDPFSNNYLADSYLQGLKEGKYTVEQLDEKVRRVLRLYFRTTMDRQRPQGFLCSESHYATAERIAEEGIVLLKNDNDILPIPTHTTKKILVVGENAIKMMTVGGGSSSLKAQREIVPLHGLMDRFASAGITVEYERGYIGDSTGSFDGVVTGQNLIETRQPQQLIDDAVAKAKAADYVIFFGGLNKSGHQDCEGADRLSYDIPYHQERLITALAAANKNFVFVSISGNPYAMPFVDEVPAILQAWYLGSEAGTAIAKVLCGDVNPSGKLPYTWNRQLNDYAPHALNVYPGTWDEEQKVYDEHYEEDVFLGYRWNDKNKITPLFAFGHGMSYTTFELTEPKISTREIPVDSCIYITVNVRNTGRRAGAEVVQLYVHDIRSSVDKPYKELKAFQKVFLQPGESRDVVFPVDESMLQYYDEVLQDWYAEPGFYTILIGTASDKLDGKARIHLR